MENVRVLGIGFLLFLIGCETDGDAYRSGASGPAMLKAAASNVSSAKQQASGEEQRKDSVPSCLGKTLGLESGIYGLPFSATTEEVMDWCVDNDMAVANYNTPENLDQRLRWIRCLNGKGIQETKDGEQA